MLASTTSSACFSVMSSGPCNCDLGIAIRPVRLDSRTPKGAMSFKNASILVGFADLEQTLVGASSGRSRYYKDLHFDNTVVCADIQYLSAKLVRQLRNRLQMFVLVSQRLTRRHGAWMVFSSLVLKRF